MPQIPQVVERMTSAYIFDMASGQVGDELKFYFHCQLADKSGYALAEIVFKQSMAQITGTLKTTRGDLGQKLVAKVEEALNVFAL